MAYGIKNKKPKIKNYEIRKYKVYSFENLPKEIQEKALQNYRYFNVEDRNMLEHDDYLIDLSAKDSTQKNIKSGETLFSWKGGSYNVGYGYRWVQFNDLKVSDDEAFRQELGVSKKVWNKVDYSFENPNREGNTRIVFTDKETGYQVDMLQKDEQKELDDAEERFSYLMKKSAENLEKDYEYQISDEAVKESLIANDYRFNEKGEID